MAGKTRNKKNMYAVTEITSYRMVCQNVMQPEGNILQCLTMSTSGMPMNRIKTGILTDLKLRALATQLLNFNKKYTQNFHIKLLSK